MGKREIRLGSTLVFDDKKEKDLIEFVETATRSRSLGKFISNLLRLYNESPSELLKDGNEIVEKMNEFGRNGLSPRRERYFNDVNKSLNEMRVKVDKIYDMCMKMHMQIQFGKKLAVEDKVKNLLSSEFIIERQIEELSEVLGVENFTHIYNSNKYLNVESKAQEVLEYIIESYDGIVEEIREQYQYRKERVESRVVEEEKIETDVVESKINLEKSEEVEIDGDVENVGEIVREVVGKKNFTETLDNLRDWDGLDKGDEEEEVIEFGPDMDVLGNFLGSF